MCLQCVMKKQFVSTLLISTTKLAEEAAVEANIYMRILNVFQRALSTLTSPVCFISILTNTRVCHVTEITEHVYKCATPSR
jgi:hypothetical protein